MPNENRQAADRERAKHRTAVNAAHDERRPFCFYGRGFVIPYNVDRLPGPGGAGA